MTTMLDIDEGLHEYLRHLKVVLPASSGSDNCFTCEQCLPTCTREASGTSGKDLITFQFPCKDSISWICCPECGNLVNCPSVDKQACKEVKSATFSISSSTTGLFRIQAHDGKFNGEVDQPDDLCPNGSGTSCKGFTTGLCEWDGIKCCVAPKQCTLLDIQLPCNSLLPEPLTVTDVFGVPSGADCLTFEVVTQDTGSTDCVTAVKRTYSYGDTSCSHTITIPKDSTPPAVVQCPGDMIGPDDCTFSDNCNLITPVDTTCSVENNVFNRTWTAKDECGNTEYVTHTVKVTCELANRTESCPYPIPARETTLESVFGLPDNAFLCDTNLRLAEPEKDTDDGGSICQEGGKTVTRTYNLLGKDDAVVATCVQTFHTDPDLNPPTPTCKDEFESICCGGGIPQATASDCAFTDNCGTPITTLTCSPFQDGLVRTWKASDGCSTSQVNKTYVFTYGDCTPAGGRD